MTNARNDRDGKLMNHTHIVRVLLRRYFSIRKFNFHRVCPHFGIPSSILRFAPASDCVLQGFVSSRSLCLPIHFSIRCTSCIFSNEYRKKSTTTQTHTGTSATTHRRGIESNRSSVSVLPIFISPQIMNHEYFIS